MENLSSNIMDNELSIRKDLLEKEAIYLKTQLKTNSKNHLSPTPSGYNFFVSKDYVNTCRHTYIFNIY